MITNRNGYETTLHLLGGGGFFIGRADLLT